MTTFNKISKENNNTTTLQKINNGLISKDPEGLVVESLKDNIDYFYDCYAEAFTIARDEYWNSLSDEEKEDYDNDMDNLESEDFESVFTNDHDIATTYVMAYEMYNNDHYTVKMINQIIHLMAVKREQEAYSAFYHIYDCEFNNEELSCSEEEYNKNVAAMIAGDY